MRQNSGTEIKSIVYSWVRSSFLQQKEISEKMDMTPAAINKMLKGDADLPLPRFMQLVHILHPSQDEVDQVFAFYCEDLKIPSSSMRLVINGISGLPQTTDRRARIHALVDRLTEKQLEALEPVITMMATQE